MVDEVRGFLPQGIAVNIRHLRSMYSEQVASFDEYLSSDAR